MLLTSSGFSFTPVANTDYALHAMCWVILRHLFTSLSPPALPKICFEWVNACSVSVGQFMVIRQYNSLQAGLSFVWSGIMHTQTEVMLLW